MKRCYRAVSGADREAWLLERRKYVTASEAAAVVGENPFKTVHQLWHDKKYGDSFKGNEHTERGQKYEPVIIGAWASKYKAPYRRMTDLLVSAEHPYLAATLDGIGRYKGKTTILEIKAPKKPWGAKGVPAYYKPQILVQMLVTGIHRAILVEGDPATEYSGFNEHHFTLDSFGDTYIRTFLGKIRDFYELLKLEELPF